MKQLTRRQFLRGALGLSATGALAPLLACTRMERTSAPTPTPTSTTTGARYGVARYASSAYS
jgi:hypothetical protein